MKLNVNGNCGERWTRWKRRDWILSLLLFCLLPTADCRLAATAAEPPSPPPGFRIVPRRPLSPAPYVGHPAPLLQLEKLEGGTEDSAGWSGRPVVLNFWASWSDAAGPEARLLQAAHDKWKQKVLVVGVEIGKTGRDPLRRFIQERRLTYRILLGSEAVTREYRILTVPTTFFIDGRGTIRDLQIGPLPAGSLERRIERILR